MENNFAKIHLTDEQFTAASNTLDELLELCVAVAPNLSDKERKQFGMVGPKRGLFINKVKDFQDSQPDLSSPEINWDEFAADYLDRQRADALLQKLRSAVVMISDFKVLSDFDNYTDALRDYQYVLYKKRFSNESGYENKTDQLKQFFPKTGKTKKLPKP